MMKHYYAVEYAYGSGIANGWPMSSEGGGSRADCIVRFTGLRARDAWVNRGPANKTAAGYREVLRANSLAIRRVNSTPGYWEIGG